jgi:hypothetical protein
MSQTAAVIDLHVSNNATLQEAFQFGTPGDTSWSLVGQNFKMEIKANRDDVSPLLTLVSPTSIVVDDVVQRVIHLNLDMVSVKAALPVGEYVYDLVMYDNNVPAIRTQLVEGRFCLEQGVTED